MKQAGLRHRVVILGGGFAGLAAALRLAGDPEFRQRGNVTLVDQNCYHLYHALLYEVATASFDVSPQDIEYLQGGVCIRLKSLGELVMKFDVDFVQGRVTGRDSAKRQVLLDGQPGLAYDDLVVALGVQPSDFGVPGVRQYASVFSTIPDALGIRERLRQCFAQAQQSGRPQHIIIVGGGATGVELSGEMLEYARSLARRHRLRSTALKLTIVEAGSRLLNGTPLSVGETARRRLATLGATIMFGVPIASVEAAAVVFKNGQRMPYDLLVWSGGVEGNRVISSLGLPTAGRGQIKVEPSLAVVGQRGVWAAGDCLSFVDPANGRPAPLVAPLAVQSGRLVAQNIVRQMLGRTLTPYQPRHSGFVIPIGGKYAVAHLGWFRASGWLGWLARKWKDLEYFLSIMEFRKAWRVFVRGARVYLKND